MSDTESRPEPVGSGRVAFDYIKTSGFRVIHVDGVLGSLTPTGHIHMALFSQRPAIPRRQVYALTATGGPGELIQSETISRDSIVREIDVDAQMSLETARNIHQWLGDRIKELEDLISKQPQSES